MTDKTLSLLGLSRRAGKLEAGFDAAVLAARAGKAALLVAAKDISEKTFKNLCYEGGRAGVPVRRLKADMAAAGKACGVKAGVLAVTDEGFAGAVCKELEKEEESL